MFWDYAIKQYRWFSNWFDNGLLNSRMTGNQESLVEERVGQYRNGDTALGYTKNRAWIGDQGLMMAGLFMLLEIFDELSKYNPLKLDIDGVDGLRISQIGFSIAKATGWALVDYDIGLFRQISKQDDDYFPFGDEEDYAPGPGIYARNLMFLALSNSDYFELFTGDTYRRIIAANASQAAGNPSKINDMWDLHTVASDLDQITTALALGVPFKIPSE